VLGVAAETALTRPVIVTGGCPPVTAEYRRSARDPARVAGVAGVDRAASATKSSSIPLKIGRLLRERLITTSSTRAHVDAGSPP
jgi:hypothetical protein